MGDLAPPRKILCSRKWFPTFSVIHPNAESKDSHKCTICFINIVNFTLKSWEEQRPWMLAVVKDMLFSYTAISNQREGWKWQRLNLIQIWAQKQSTIRLLNFAPVAFKECLQSATAEYIKNSQLWNILVLMPQILPIPINKTKETYLLNEIWAALEGRWKRT